MSALGGDSMSTDTTRSTALVAVLSILGILAISIVVGMLLFQKKESPGGDLDIGTALSYKDSATTQDEFDPISWARDGAAYPPLEEPGSEEGEFKVDYTGDSAIPDDKTVTTDPMKETPVVVSQPAAISTTRNVIDPPKTVYKEIREIAPWIQVTSVQNQASAERVREELAAAGFPANVMSHNEEGVLTYRVRIGAFDGQEEADYYLEQIVSSTKFEDSYITLAPVTRRVAIEN